MDRNIGEGDRAFRLVVGTLLVAFYFGTTSRLISIDLGGIYKEIAGILGFILILTGWSRRCALYPLFHINTIEKKNVVSVKVKPAKTAKKRAKKK